MTTDIDGNYRGVYTYGIERISAEDLVSIEGRPNDPLYYLYDAIGTTTSITNMNAGIIDSNRFAPYGEPLDPVAKNSRLTNSSFGFTGEMHDIEARLVYLRARYYEPGTARFIQQDTLFGDIREPLTRNLYIYGNANPLTYVDPSGHRVEDNAGGGSSFVPLKYGDKGSEVVTLQHALNYWTTKYAIPVIDKYLDTLKVDGDFGSKTKARVSMFKTNEGIENSGSKNGVVDYDTWLALKPYRETSSNTLPGTGNDGQWKPTSVLAKAVVAAGFLYDPGQDIIYSKMYPWQREFGYAQLYDDNAPIVLSSIIDSEPIYFNYGGKDWMIELWKGQYGLQTGAEIGVYNRDTGKADIRDSITGKFFDCVTDDERLTMSFTLYENGTEVFSRGPELHWWLTGFKWGEFSNPDELTMDLSITFDNSDMIAAFIGDSESGLMGAGYNNYRIDGNTISFTFSSPYSVQPDSRADSFDEVQGRNKSLVEDYQKIKRYLGISSNDPNLIQENFIRNASDEVKEAYERIVNYFNSIN